MDITVKPGKLCGTVAAIPSKSQAHRYLICAALSSNPTTLICPRSGRDIDATVDCLNALGAKILRSPEGFQIEPIRKTPQTALLKCQESGSTLRFLLPIVGAMGVDATFQMEGRLPQRPLSPLWEEMQRMGCTLTRPTEHSIRCTGKLKSGQYRINGSISSQFITGLLFATSLLLGNCDLLVTGNIESQNYITMTEEAMHLFGAPHYHSPGTVTVEGDWSNGAFWVAAQILGSPITVRGLNAISLQGDRAIVDIAHQLQECCPTVSAADIPDLIPVLSVIAAVNHGAVFTDIRRLRLKESDRVATIIGMIEALGGRAEASENTLTVHGTGLTGGIVDSNKDHRIAMAAAIAATVCTEPVTILGAEAVDKSYPDFWDEYHRLGGNYEQHIR